MGASTVLCGFNRVFKCEKIKSEGGTGNKSEVGFAYTKILFFFFFLKSDMAWLVIIVVSFVWRFPGFTAGCNLDRDCLNPHCGLPFESDRPPRSCVNTANKQMSFRIGFGDGINEIDWATYAFSWLSKWWTNSSRLLTMATSSSSSSFSRSFCASVFCQSAKGWKTKDTWNEPSQHSCDLINRKRSVQHTRSPYPIQFE